MAKVHVSVLGAGVVGLTTALLLSRDERFDVTIIAKHMPGDYDIEYASPWAGANFLPVGKPGSQKAQFERDTWPELSRLAGHVPEAGIHFQEAIIYNRVKDVRGATANWFAELLKTNAWFKDVVPNFRVLSKSELKPGIDSATSFTSVCINTAIYLPWLAGQCLKNGVTLKRGIVKHVCEAAELHHSGRRADIVVNCTGLSARRLGGVRDKSVYPGRGQTVLVRNDPGVMPSISGNDDGEDEVTYVMLRAAGGGCILGGSFQEHSWESQPDPSLAVRIMKRCVELCPDLTGGKGIEHLSVVRHGVGLRPLRTAGPRVEREKIEGVEVVHQYGHGGFGYQSSYGSAMEAVRLVEQIVGSGKAKL